MMNDPSHLPLRDPGAPADPSWRKRISSAWRFWERRRLAYNLVLTVVVIGLFVQSWPHFRPVFTRSLWLPALAYMLFLAALGNICYCAAYPVDLVLQWAAKPEFMRRSRVALWWAGLLLACVLALYWMEDEVW
jgi:hypothetical protein